MSEPESYVPPKVWVWDKPNGGAFANINRPTAGATHDRPLPRGEHALQVYSMGTGNGRKVTIMLEELLAAGITAAEYDAWMIDISAGDQFGSGFVDLNPNSKIAGMIDYSGPHPIKLFETGAILLHLAEKFGQFMPADPVGRGECLSWLFWQTGSAPFLPGGLGHFYKFAPVKLEYPINRYAMEVKRQLDVLDRRLAERAFILGEDYTIADIAIFPWYGGIFLDWGYGLAEFLGSHEYPHVERWARRIEQRPAVQRGIRVNRTGDTPPGLIRERHAASDLD
ncbi:glutathione-dependent disulfide-bond oxidoreductase [Caballeronia insecticola]|uniref:Putative glutathione S-transferase YghU n=1 Tax=Caballeronia insecticola TaxID=758793 RepID=A0A060PHA9_9BURK|nr:glutathione-dependent disulfide-bond oxidoreductase [Caballeronia insecticola]BAO94167.1 putative glutathione S-transferase YghU [Caballeronia insecticola]